MNATLFPPNSSLFLGDLSKFCTEVDLEKIFSQFGEINQIRIMRNTNTGKALSYGFISFMSNECAASAMEKLNGISLHGRSMRIGWAAHNLKTHKTEEPAIINSVYVRFITPKTSEYVTEEVIHRAFDQFGSVVDVSIKQSAVDQRSGRQSGYGFVHFSADHAGIIAAFDALSRMNNNTYDGVTYSVEPSKNLLRQMDEMNLGVGGLAGRGGGGVGGGGHTNSNHASSMSSSAPSQHHQPHQQQQSLYGRNALPQGRMDAPYRPQQHHQGQGRDDYPKLYQQPSHMSHHDQHLSQHGRHGQGTAPGGSVYPPSATSRYDSGAQSYGVASVLQHHRQQQQPQPHFEPHTHRYAPPQQQQSYGRQGNQHGGDSSMYASGFGPAPSSLRAEDLYSRPHSCSQSLDPLSLSVLAPGGQGQGQGSVKGSSQGHSPRAVSQTMSTSPDAAGGAGHVRHSSRDLDFAPAVLAPVDEYVSSYLIEKPAIDERFFDAPGNSAHQQESNPVPYSYGQPHAQPLGGMVTGDRDRRGGLSSNSHSFYSNLPMSSARPPHAPSQHGNQQQSRRPLGVTDLEIGRSRSMSSAGLPTYSTNATTDCEGGFFKSANSSFTENANPRFAHVNSFGDFHSPHNHTALLSQSADPWTGISDQQTGLLTHEALQRQPVHHPHYHAHSHHQPLASSMRKLSMQSVTTNGAEEEEDVNDLVEDDYTFAAALASTHETAGSQDSLFNYMNSNASSFALPSPSYGSSYSSSQNNCSMNAKGMGFSSKDGCVTAGNPPQQKGPSSSGISAQQQHQQEKHYGSEMDELALEAKQLSLSSVSSGSNTARSHGSNPEDKKTSPKSRQLAVTHFFKPVASV